MSTLVPQGRHVVATGANPWKDDPTRSRSPEGAAQELQSAIGIIRQVIPAEELNELQPSGPATVYTTLATVWMMILQRLGGGLSMKAVVKDAVLHGSEFFPC